VNPTEIKVQWSGSTDDGLHILYEVYVDGVATVDTGWTQNAVLHGLSPETTYDITVVARDLYGGNESPPSNVVVATTAAVSGTDTEAPSAPPSVWGGDVGGLEVHLFWTEAFDNQTAQAGLAYEVYLNGTLDHTVADDRAVIYVSGPGEHTFDIVAVDDAGNRSAPTSLTVLVQ